MAVFPSFADGEKTRDEAEAKDAETHCAFKVREEAHHYRRKGRSHADERAAEKVCGVVQTHGFIMSLLSVIGTWQRVSTEEPSVLSISKTELMLAEAEIALSRAVVEKLTVAVLPKIGVSVAATVGTAS